MQKEVFIKGYVEKLKNLLDNIDINSIAKIIESLEETQKNSGTIYVIGNG